MLLSLKINILTSKDIKYIQKLGSQVKNPFLINDN